MSGLETEVRYLSGVGEKRAKSLAKLKIHTFHDLILNYPRAYEDRTVFKKIRELQIGESVCVKADIASPPIYTYVRKGMELLKFRVTDGESLMNVTVFNRAYLRNELNIGDMVVLFGKVGGTVVRPELINPAVE